jgi:glycosyltransferase involved in cell wall biosynthesis
MTTVSVIIATYNRAHVVGDAVESVFRQTHPALEVIVVDDGSTDATPSTLARFGDRIRVLRQENRGVAAARNAGIAASSGDYVLFLDSDDVLAPPCIERELARYAADPSLGLVFVDAEFFDDDGRLVRVANRGPEGRVAADLVRLEQDIVSTTSGVMVPRRVIEDVGVFDERLRVSEDWDLCFRIATRYAVGRVAELLVRCASQQDGLHLDIPAMEHGMLLAFEKAFAAADREVRALRRRAYARLHFILAGCYFQTGRFGRCALHLMHSARYAPIVLLRTTLSKVART